ncbi:MAG: hypothetical protein Q9188_006916 [Gyalolechia gomerana]
MRPQSSSLVAICLFIWTLPLALATSWGFDDATVSVHGKKAGVGGGAKEKLVENKSLSHPISLGASDTLKLLLTTTEGRKAKRPHQAFLLLREPKSNLDTSFPLSVKESGKGKLELSHKDLPTQFLTGSRTLSAFLVIASFGTSKPFKSPAFDLRIELDPSAPPPPVNKPLRYGRLPEIHHLFKPDPRSPPKIITIFFSAAVVAALPSLLFVIKSLTTMGNFSSKAARSAASASTRKLPTRTPGSNPTTNAPSHSPPPAGQPTAPGPTVHPQNQTSDSRDESNNKPIYPFYYTNQVPDPPTEQKIITLPYIAYLLRKLMLTTSPHSHKSRRLGPRLRPLPPLPRARPTFLHPLQFLHILLGTLRLTLPNHLPKPLSQPRPQDALPPRSPRPRSRSRVRALTRRRRGKEIFGRGQDTRSAGVEG